MEEKNIYSHGLADPQENTDIDVLQHDFSSTHNSDSTFVFLNNIYSLALAVAHHGETDGAISPLLNETGSAAAPPIATATTITWGGGTGDWFDPSNWSPAQVPQSGDTAFIGSGTAQMASSP